MRYYYGVSLEEFGRMSLGQIFAAKKNLIQIKKIENGDTGPIGSGMTDAEANTMQLEAQVKALAARGRVGPISINDLLNPSKKE